LKKGLSMKNFASRLWHNLLSCFSETCRNQKKRTFSHPGRALHIEPLEMRQMLSVLYWDPDGNEYNNNTSTGAGLGGSSSSNRYWQSGTGAYWYDPTKTQGSREVIWNNNNVDDAVFMGKYYGSNVNVSVNGTVKVNSISFFTDTYYTANNYIVAPVDTNANIYISASNTSFEAENYTYQVSATISCPITGSGGLGRKRGHSTFLLTAA
jgi:hypothetical protein